MKLQKGYLVAFMATAALGLSSCGGDPLAAELTGPSGSATPEMMKSMASQLSTLVTSFELNNSAHRGPGGALPGGGVFLAGSDYDSCTTESGASGDGPDGDGIRLHHRRTFNCNALTIGASRITMAGLYEEIDKDDTVAGDLGGFRYNYDFNFTTSGGSHDFTTRWNGFWDVTSSATSVIYDSNFGFTFSGTDNGVTSSLGFRNQFKTTLTPTDMDHITTAGGAVIAGFYGISGNIGGDNLGVAFEISSRDLTYDGSCTSGFFKSGSISFVDGAGNTMKVAYSSSCARTITFNGQTIDGLH